MDTVFSRIDQWHAANGGHKGPSPAPHALRALREMVELCIECGAGAHDISEAVEDELRRQSAKGNLRIMEVVTGRNCDMDKVAEEVADVHILLHILCKLYGVNPLRAMYNKVNVLESRQWEADGNGVLWRPK